MGFLSTKVVAGALATTVFAGGVMFTGGQTIDNVKNQLDSFKDKIVQYEANEGSLLSKIGLIKADVTSKLTDANGKIISAKTEINNLKASKSLLEANIKNLNNEITGLRADVAKLNTDLETANAKIAEKEQLLEEANAELARVNSELATLEGKYNALVEEYNALVAVSEANATEAKRANEEVTEANEKVSELEVKSNEVDTATAGAEPLSQEELDAIGTEVSPSVFDAELVVKNLQLTYIQNGNSEEFKAEHPDLDIQDGDRVWRITNNNEFKVYVEYKKGSETGELVANPSQTFYMTETGGTMIIKWQDENGVWKQTVKAGA